MSATNPIYEDWLGSAPSAKTLVCSIGLFRLIEPGQLTGDSLALFPSCKLQLGIEFRQGFNLFAQRGIAISTYFANQLAAPQIQHTYRFPILQSQRFTQICLEQFK